MYIFSSYKEYKDEIGGSSLALAIIGGIHCTVISYTFLMQMSAFLLISYSLLTVQDIEGKVNSDSLVILIM